ncbi:hypothetical protein J7481_17055 [Labrenzia sp. R4_2]|uniref:hypothetical protein n=1 Tax=Labrenzia sp. R4_2 TaxID=2821107 RepID=UPI001ADD2C78|nr:hypothetical protein [Labrenzia sp. R4_2]MBO9421221.1 hypothetical protein [Labrenzia sp. R4_2]
MADYYSILKKTIASLPESNGAARRSVYSRARNAIVNQLKAYEPPLSPSEITAEQLRLEEAIRKVEAEAARESLGLQPSAPPAPATPAAPPVREPEPAPSVPAATTTSPVETPAAPAPQVTSPEPSAYPVEEPASAPSSDASYDSPPQAAPLSGTTGSSLAEPEGPVSSPETPPAYDPVSLEPAPVSDDQVSQTEPLFEDEVVQPQTGTAVLTDAPVSSRASRSRSSASAALRGSDEKSRTVPIAAAAVVAVLVLGAAAYFFLSGPSDEAVTDAAPAVSQEPETTAVTEPAAPVEDTVAASSEDADEASKNTDRLLNETDANVVAPDARAVTTTTINPQETAPGTVAQPSIVTNVESTPSADVDTPATDSAEVSQGVQPDSLAAVSPEQSEPAPAAQVPASGAQRSILYEEGADASSTGTAAQGAVIWTLGEETDLGGEAQSVLSAAVEIPERDIKVDIRIKPNDDTSLPASHLVEIKYELPEGFSGGDIVNVPGLVMKPTEEARGDALIGASVKVSPGFFWIALSSLPNEQQRNLALLRERGWIDIPMLYENGKRGILTLEKGPIGEDAVEKAVTAWQAG